MEITFQRAAEIVVVRIKGNHLLFSTITTNFQQFVPIDYLQLNVDGILKEFPDLKGMPVKEMRIEALSRLKEHIKGISGEEEIKKYILEELEKYGWDAILLKKDGFRPMRLK